MLHGLYYVDDVVVGTITASIAIAIAVFNTIVNMHFVVVYYDELHLENINSNSLSTIKTMPKLQWYFLYIPNVNNNFCLLCQF